MISAKVAAIVSDTQVAFNVGINHGIERGSRVKLYNVIVIKDPDSKEVLGKVHVRKLNLIVDHVQDRLCVATVTDYRESNEDDPALLVSITKVRRRKTVTSNFIEEQGGSVIYVEVGEDATIEPPMKVEPPKPDQS